MNSEIQKLKNDKRKWKMLKQELEKKNEDLNKKLRISEKEIRSMKQKYGFFFL